MNKYFLIFWYTMKDSLSHRGKLLSLALMIIMRVGVLFAIYNYAFGMVGGSIKGLSITPAIWGMMIYFIFLALRAGQLRLEIKDDVRGGEFETKLNKPFDYLFFTWARRLGLGLPNMFMILFTAVPILVLFVGLPNFTFSWEWLMAVLLLICFGTLLSFLLFSITALLVFWLDDPEPSFWIVDKAVMVLGGAYMPVALFPEHIRLFAELSPFGAVVSFNQLFQPDFITRWPSLLIAQLVWSLICLLILIKMYTIAKKRVSIEGS